VEPSPAPAPSTVVSVYDSAQRWPFNARNSSNRRLLNTRNTIRLHHRRPRVIPGVYKPHQTEKQFLVWSEEWRKKRVPGAGVSTSKCRHGQPVQVGFRICVKVRTAQCPGDRPPRFPVISPVDPTEPARLPLIPETNGRDLRLPGVPVMPTNGGKTWSASSHNFTTKSRHVRYIPESGNGYTPPL